MLLAAKVSKFKSMIRPILAGVGLVVHVLHPVQCTNTDNNSWYFTSLPLEEVALIHTPFVGSSAIRSKTGLRRWWIARVNHHSSLQKNTKVHNKDQVHHNQVS